MIWGLLGCAPMAMNWPERQDFPIYEASDKTDAPSDPSELRILTWNVKFAGARIDFWFDGWGDRVHMTEEEVMYNLDNIEALVVGFDPDIILMQEVDHGGAKRTAYVDMVDEILNQTEMNYGAFVPVWQSAFVAEEGLGPVDMGQAAFSRWPITKNTRVDLGPIGDQPGYVRYFYLDRAIQRIEIDVDGTTLTVLNNHPDAYGTDGTKERQINQILDEALAVDGPLLVGGDFNAVPPGSLNLTDFPDREAEIDSEGAGYVDYADEGDELMAGFYENWTPAISLDDYQQDTLEEQARYFSHSVSKDVFWNCAIDYLFTSTSFTDGVVIQAPGDGGTTLDPMQLSDHAPLFAIMEAP